MEGSASAPYASDIEAEPVQWQPRATWVGARLMCGAVTFFFTSFVFAYFYLRLLDVNHSWTIGKVHSSLGWGIAITAVLVVSAVLLRVAVVQSVRVVALTAGALVLALLAIVLQMAEYPGLDFGASSGGYASVFIGWTATYAVLIVPFLYWIETQVASFWRERRQGTAQTGELLSAGLEACSLVWGFYVAIGVVAFILLYVV